MRVEKISDTKVRIFISYEDLEERGIDRDEIWLNGRKVQELFWDMMERAYLEVGFEVVGPIAVEAFTMPTEGVVVIVTQVASLPPGRDSEEEEKLIVNPTGAFVFVFQEFEDVVRAAHALLPHFQWGCSLFSYKKGYYLWFDADSVDEDVSETLLAILSEYGEPSGVTHAMLAEYGKLIMENDAIPRLCRFFG
jgi:adapter protein MecA 1/2